MTRHTCWTKPTQAGLPRRPAKVGDIYNMESDFCLHLIRWFVTEHVVYSKDENAWILSVPSLKEIIRREVGTPLSVLTAIDETLELGVAKGYWSMGSDHAGHVAVVVTH